MIALAITACVALAAASWACRRMMIQGEEIRRLKIVLAKKNGQLAEEREVCKALLAEAVRRNVEDCSMDEEQELEPEVPEHSCKIYRI